jgi:hypothetical protein
MPKDVISEYKMLKSCGWRDASEITDAFNEQHNSDLHPTLAGQSAAVLGTNRFKKKGSPTLYDPMSIPWIHDRMLYILKRRQSFVQERN